MKLEFTTTAMARPSILQATYESFSSHLKGVDFSESTLYLNIDPLPPDVDPNACVEVAKQFFGTVIPNMPSSANFTAAVQWLWKSVQGEFFIHLEDDWSLSCDVNISAMLKRLEPEDVLQVPFRAYYRAYKGKERSYQGKVCLSPSLLQGDFARKMSKIFNLSQNPEIQLRGDNLGGGRAVPYPKREIIIKDIGRKWLSESAYEKPKVKHKFTSWIGKK